MAEEIRKATVRIMSRPVARGFSIVEVMVAIIIASILTVGLVVSLRPTVENTDRAAAAAWAEQAAQSWYSWVRAGGDTGADDTEKAAIIGGREQALDVVAAPTDGEFPLGQVAVWTEYDDTFLAVQGQGFCVLRRVRVSLNDGGGVTSATVDENCGRHLATDVSWAYRK